MCALAEAEVGLTYRGLCFNFETSKTIIITDTGVSRKKYSEWFPVPVGEFESLLENLGRFKCLEMINISYWHNRGLFDDDRDRKFAERLRSNRSVTLVNVYSTTIRSDVLQDIRFITKRNSMIFVDNGLNFQGKFWDFDTCTVVDLKREFRNWGEINCYDDFEYKDEPLSSVLTDDDIEPLCVNLSRFKCLELID
jgi:hypothetical protein